MSAAQNDTKRKMKRRRRDILLGCLSALWFVTPALAADAPKSQPPAELFPKARPTTKSFYGWQILAGGEAGAMLAAAGVLLPDKPLDSWPATAAFLVGMPVFALSGPTAHWSHGDFSKGLISFGGNIAIPLIGGFTGRAIRCNETNAPDDCAQRGFYTGLVVSAMIVPVIDALVLGWEDVPVDEALRHGSPRLGSIAPWTIVGKDGLFQAGLSGRF
jgi:hypothetical protein